MGVYELYLFLKELVECGDVKNDGTDNTEVRFVNKDSVHFAVTDLSLDDRETLYLYE